METPAHQGLKRIAVAYLLSQGCRAAAVEVRCPLSRFLVDAAGYADVAMPSDAGPLFSGTRPRRCPPRTIIIECKQDRADFLRDRRDVDRLLDLRAMLNERRERMERTLVRAAEPHLRRSGEALFPECEEWDFERSRLPGYRRLLGRLRTIDEQLHGGTKFWRAARYRLADRLYILAPRGLVRRREVPPGWGLLEWMPGRAAAGSRAILDGSGVSGVRMARAAPECPSREDRRERLLRNIAVAATRASLAGLSD